MGFVSARVAALGSLLVAIGCGTVNPGQDIEFAQITYDANFFYCAVEPMLFSEHCGPGEGSDPASGCHFNVTTFRLLDHPAIQCNGNNPQGLQIPSEAQSNYRSASSKMSPDATQAPLLNRPTNQSAHPRKIFDLGSAQANLIRQWATKYTSQ
ncbi:MAG TPA: hypothetical protein VHU80_00025 [Polyangiaceae bacterium]|nr:hypothetical protein [Polyangiaceae bacterium]